MKENQKKNGAAVRFRHFDRKAYSAFRSMKKEVSIGVLSFCMLTFANVDEVAAQVEVSTQSVEGEHELNEVEVTATRIPFAVSQAVRMVTVLSREVIEAAPVQSVNDLLKYAVGVDVRQRGVQGMQTDISIRGGTFDQITFLLNGVNVCDPQTGHNVADFPIDLNDIERIEILEGPAARVYGTSSLLGAVNIITRTEKENGVEVRAQGGSYGSLQGGGTLRWGNERLNNQLSGGYSRSDGYLRNSSGRLNTDFFQSRTFYQGNYTHPKAQIRWQAGYSDKGYGSNTFYSALYDDQYEQIRKYFVSVQGETKGFLHFQPSAYYTHNEDHFELIRGSEEKVKFNDHRTHITGLNLNTYFTTDLGKTALGGEMRHEQIYSTLIGEPLSEPKMIRGTDRQYLYGLGRTNTSFYLEHNILIPRWVFSLGVMANRNTAHEDKFHFYPGADVSWQITDRWKFYASWNTSLRMPTFTELYYTTNETHIGNKHLKPEEMTAFEIDLNYQQPGIRLTGSLYHHRGKNLIDWVQAPGEDVWRSINHTQVNTTGLELGCTIDFPFLFSHNYWLQRLHVGYSYIDRHKKERGDYVSQYTLEHLKHKLVVQGEHRLSRQWDLSWAFRWQDREGSYKRYENKQEMGIIPYHPYALLDAKLTWRNSCCQGFVKAENLLNHTYYDHGNIPQPGCWIWLGGSYKLQF